jgi:hypothetical protein
MGIRANQQGANRLTLSVVHGLPRSSGLAYCPSGQAACTLDMRFCSTGPEGSSALQVAHKNGLQPDTTPWHEMVAAAVNGGAGEPHTVTYAVAETASLGQMKLVLLVRRGLLSALTDVSIGAVATGVAGVGVNKGAVGIACKVWGNHLCFVNSHLAAHQDKVSERNRMYKV